MKTGEIMVDAGFVREYLVRSVAVLQEFSEDTWASDVISDMAARTVVSLRNGGKLLIAGNGGSAADAQHIAGELISRLMYDRPPLAALALTVDSSAMTATANDYGYEHVFERQVLGLGRSGDVFLGISTSGRSRNVLRALEAARGAGLTTLGFCGANPDPMQSHCDLLVCAPSRETPLIQQVHITAAHIFCALVERGMFPRGAD